MHYVYLIQSRHARTQRYIGQTANLRQRLADHNAGKSIHTRQFKPWNLIGYLAFAENRRARAFERYLKTGSGKTFANRHLL